MFLWQLSSPQYLSHISLRLCHLLLGCLFLTSLHLPTQSANSDHAQILLSPEIITMGGFISKQSDHSRPSEETAQEDFMLPMALSGKKTHLRMFKDKTF